MEEVGGGERREGKGELEEGEEGKEEEKRTKNVFEKLKSSSFPE